MEDPQIFGLGTFTVKILWELGGEVNWFYVVCVCVCVCVCMYMRAHACMGLCSHAHTYDCLAKAEAVHCLV